MVTRKITIVNEIGLHERLATKIIKKASTYKSEILITKGKAKINAKSVLGLCCIGIGQGDILEIEAIGVDEELAANELAEYILGIKV